MAYGDKDGYADREMHKIKCSDCGQEAEVPFKPSGDRPVYCKDCYQKHRPPRRY
jgi:CxxC-x17-CxxC domain-containing protein